MECITLQVGNFSNHVGAHFWNSRESLFLHQNTDQIDHDTLFREGVTLEGRPTYTPRLICVDRKGSLNTLSEQGTLYSAQQQQEASIPWAGNVSKVEQPRNPKNSFLQTLDAEEEGKKVEELEPLGSNDVAGWTDYLHPHFHPNSIYIVKEFLHEEPFNCFQSGQVAMKTAMDDIEDKLHFYIEECDNFQGFQIMVDSDNAFAGFGADVCQYIRDDYSKKAIVCAGVYHPAESASPTPFVNSSRLMMQATELNALYVPISLLKGWNPRTTCAVDQQSLTFDIRNTYESSAVVAAAWDTLTLPCSYKRNGTSLGGIVNDLKSSSKIAELLYSIPAFGATKEAPLSKVLDEANPEFISMLPSAGAKCTPQTIITSTRGITGAILKPSNKALSTRAAAISSLTRCETAEEMVTRYYGMNKSAETFHVFGCETPLTTRLPFPNHMLAADNPTEVPVAASLQVCPSRIKESVKALKKEISRVRAHQVEEMTKEDLEELGEQLQCFIDE